MVLRLLIDAVHEDETRVVIADNTRIHDFDFVTAAKKQVKGNIYLAKITRVEPSLQAAFVEYGGGKQGFLPFAEIHPDYYQIPMADRKRLLEEAEGDSDDEHQAPHESMHDSNAPITAETSSLDALQSDEEHASHGVAGSVHVSHNADNAQFSPSAGEHLGLPATYSEPLTFLEPAPPMDATVPQQPDVMENTQPVPLERPRHDTESGVVPSDIIGSDANGEVPAADVAPHNPDQALDEQLPAGRGEAQEHAEAGEIETLASDEDAVRQTRPPAFHRRYKIQEVIKRNQIVLVQVIKEERGNKGVSLTTFISLAGRYCVLMPNSPKGGGISRKIMSGDDRRRLKEISAELKTVRGMSAIIRTAGIDRTRAEIKRDYEYLVKLWESIRAQTLSSTAPALVYEEGDLIKRTIRDLYSSDIEEIIVEGEQGFNQAKDFLKMILPSHGPRVKLHKDNIPLFYAYNIEEQLASMYDPVVKLRSGGYIVLNPTEALISIDVNSGRSTGERNIEETATKTNLEAVAEIARQLRLRDLAGLIVIDLIDMMDSRNRRSVERALKDALKLDRAKIQIGRISPFGLMEMSRQRLRPSLAETSTMECPHCEGRGIIRSDASVALQVVRAMEKEAASGQFSELKLTITPTLALDLLNSRRDALTGVEQKYAVHIVMQTDASLPQGSFRLDKVKSASPRKQPAAIVHEPVSLDQSMIDDLPAYDEDDTQARDSSDSIAAPENGAASSEDRTPRRGRRGGRGRRSGRNGTGERSERNPERGEVSDAAPNPMNGPVPTEAAAPEDNAPSGLPREGSNERGERGGRNRRPRKWRDRRPRGESENGEPRSVNPPIDDIGGDHSSDGSREFAGNDNRTEQPRQSGGSASVSENRDSHNAIAINGNNGLRERQPAGDGASAQPPAPPVRLYSSGATEAANGAPPPLDQQKPQDAAAKKGWWRRIVES